MPIFEYKCKECDSKYEVLHKSSEKQEDIFCPNCKSAKHIKLVSSFSANVQGSSDFGGGCSDGSCGMPSYGGGCANGMCGLN
jgi:putative FmdB family regulatory protein